MTNNNANDIIIYRTDDGQARLEVRLHGETIWLTQTQLAELLDVNVPVVPKQIRNILASGELDSSATVSKMERV